MIRMRSVIYSQVIQEKIKFFIAYLQLLKFEVVSKNYFKVVKIGLYSVTMKE